MCNISKTIERWKRKHRNQIKKLGKGEICTIQFTSAIRAVKPDLERQGFNVLIPQSKPLSAGEVLGYTAPKISRVWDHKHAVLVFVADGRFHFEAFMIANPKMKAFRYDPYLGKLFLEEYDHKGMRETRRRAIARAREAKTWGIVLGTLGRQEKSKILERLEEKMREQGIISIVVLMSELSPTRVALFEDSVDAWVQIACPRLSIDWGEAFHKPLLTTFEAEISLGFIPGWWENGTSSRGDSLSGCYKEDKETSCACRNESVKDNKNRIASIEVRTDSQTLTTAIKKGVTLSEIYGVLIDISNLLSLFQFANVFFTHRQFNVLADKLAKKAINEPSTTLCF